MDNARIELIFDYDRAMRNVYRYQTIHTVRKQNVAEHSNFVGILFIEICRDEGCGIDTCDILYVMRHDLMETITGDLPYPVKESIKEEWETAERRLSLKNRYLPYYTDKSCPFKDDKTKYTIFNAAEAIEVLMFCLEELEAGNRHEDIIKIVEQYTNSLTTFCVGIDSISRICSVLFDQISKQLNCVVGK